MCCVSPMAVHVGEVGGLQISLWDMDFPHLRVREKFLWIPCQYLACLTCEAFRDR